MWTNRRPRGAGALKPARDPPIVCPVTTHAPATAADDRTLLAHLIAIPAMSGVRVLPATAPVDVPVSTLVVWDDEAPVEAGALVACPGTPPSALPGGCVAVICRHPPAADLGVPALVLAPGAPWGSVIAELVAAIAGGSTHAVAVAARSALHAPLVEGRGHPGLAAVTHELLGTPVAILDEYLDIRGSAGLSDEEDAFLEERHRARAGTRSGLDHRSLRRGGDAGHQPLHGHGLRRRHRRAGGVGAVAARADPGRGRGRARRGRGAGARPGGGAHRDRVAPARRPHRGADGGRGRQPRVAGAAGAPPRSGSVGRGRRPDRQAPGPAHRGPDHHGSPPGAALPAAGAGRHGPPLAAGAGRLERGPPAGPAPAHLGGRAAIPRARRSRPRRSRSASACWPPPARPCRAWR